jgi:hypothetical protein
MKEYEQRTPTTKASQWLALTDLLLSELRTDLRMGRVLEAQTWEQSAALARAQVRSGDRVQIAAYLGKSERFDGAIADFAKTYADQIERDHAALCAAVKSGKVAGDTGA